MQFLLKDAAEVVVHGNFHTAQSREEMFGHVSVRNTVVQVHQSFLAALENTYVLNQINHLVALGHVRILDELEQFVPVLGHPIDTDGITLRQVVFVVEIVFEAHYTGLGQPFVHTVRTLNGAVAAQTNRVDVDKAVTEYLADEVVEFAQLAGVVLEIGNDLGASLRIVQVAAQTFGTLRNNLAISRIADRKLGIFARRHRSAAGPQDRRHRQDA